MNVMQIISWVLLIGWFLFGLVFLITGIQRGIKRRNGTLDD